MTLHSTHYLYALPHAIRLVAANYRANVFPSQLLLYLDKSSKPPSSWDSLANCFWMVFFCV